MEALKDQAERTLGTFFFPFTNLVQMFTPTTTESDVRVNILHIHACAFLGCSDLLSHTCACLRCKGWRLKEFSRVDVSALPRQN